MALSPHLKHGSLVSGRSSAPLPPPDPPTHARQRGLRPLTTHQPHLRGLAAQLQKRDASPVLRKGWDRPVPELRRFLGVRECRLHLRSGGCSEPPISALFIRQPELLYVFQPLSAMRKREPPKMRIHANFRMLRSSAELLSAVDIWLDRLAASHACAEVSMHTERRECNISQK